MTALVTERFHNLAGTLDELKVRVRTALATELASAVGTAVRDVLVVAMIDRIVATPSRSLHSPPVAWRAEESGRRDGSETAHDPWADDDDARGERVPARYNFDRDEVEPLPAIPVATVVAVGIRAGRWWLARHGTVSTAFGVGALATVLGFTGGPLARAALAILAAATDLLTAESALARPDHS